MLSLSSHRDPTAVQPSIHETGRVMTCAFLRRRAASDRTSSRPIPKTAAETAAVERGAGP